MLRELGAAFARLATETHSKFLSLFGAVSDTSLLKDVVHPDAAGYAVIAQALGLKLQGWMLGGR